MNDTPQGDGNLSITGHIKSTSYPIGMNDTP